MIILVVSSVLAAPTSESCCREKEVGDILYTLVESDQEEATTTYGCMDGCVYMTEDPTDRFCFKAGDLVVTCLESRAHGWCYEGECGPDHWAEMYPVWPGDLRCT